MSMVEPCQLAGAVVASHEDGRKMLASRRFFSYNDNHLLLFDQVPKREGGEVKISLVELLVGCVIC